MKYIPKYTSRLSHIDRYDVYGSDYSVDAFQVDKLEQAENVRSEEEQKAEERPIVFGMNIYSLPL